MWGPLYLLASFTGAAVLLLLLFKLIQHVFLRREESHVEEGKKNLARALFFAGNTLGVFTIAASAVRGALAAEVQADPELELIGDRWPSDMLWIAIFGVTSLVLFMLLSHLGVALLLKARLPTELQRGNVAAGVAAGAHSIATAIIVGRAMGGRDLAALGTSLVFLLIAQASLHLLVLLFRALTSYNDAEEIIGENLAASLSYAGLTIAVALIVGRAVEGDFEGWEASLVGYSTALGFGIFLWPVRQLVVQGLLLGARPTLRGGQLDIAIARDRNVGMGAIEGVCYVAAGLAISRFG